MSVFPMSCIPLLGKRFWLTHSWKDINLLFDISSHFIVTYLFISLFLLIHTSYCLVFITYMYVSIENVIRHVREEIPPLSHL